MEWVKTVAAVLGVLAVLTGVAFLGMEVVEARKQHQLMWEFLAAQVGTVAGEDGKPIPITRADVLQVISANALKKEKTNEQ